MEQVRKKMLVGIVVVAYCPDERALLSNLKKLSDLSFRTFVIDNTPQRCLENVDETSVCYVPLKENKGIACAQNIGIQRARQEGCTHIVLFDQDSDFDAAYVWNIVTRYDELKKSHKALFLLGPRVLNKTTGEAYHSVLHKESVDSDGFVKKREIISSGSCTDMATLEKVGLTDERLFIDYVDFEWCWRAGAKGLYSGETTEVVLEHKVGQNELHIGRYLIIISAPFRYYYQNRNYLYLLRRAYVPLQWKVATGIKMLLRLLYFPLCVENGGACWKYMVKGIKEGLKK